MHPAEGARRCDLMDGECTEQKGRMNLNDASQKKKILKNHINLIETTPNSHHAQGRRGTLGS